MSTAPTPDAGRTARLQATRDAVVAAGFAIPALGLIADAMGRAARATGGGYVSPDQFVLTVCLLAEQRWGPGAAAIMAQLGLWSSRRIGELAHLVSDGMGVPTGPESVADYAGCATGSLVLPGGPPAPPQAGPVVPTPPPPPRHR